MAFLNKTWTGTFKMLGFVSVLHETTSIMLVIWERIWHSLHLISQIQTLFPTTFLSSIFNWSGIGLLTSQ